ncbi:hydroxyacid-oxoacid transhydrogenase [Pseudogymnoascus sp. 24MN13]|nr:hydroxyacid-oxoacid transhydrogenase [Pseudogymnoascus sp. 24MN13]
MAASSIRFGPGVTKEVGMDFKNMGAKRVCVVTDSTVKHLNAMKQVQEGLDQEGIDYIVYDGVRVEPKDTSIKEAIAFVKPYAPDAFLAVGGGSGTDDRQAHEPVHLLPQRDHLDFVNAPLGKGLPIDKPLLPLIRRPDRRRHGAETTGSAIFDLASARAKPGVAHRALKPTLGICDPLNTRTMPSAVHASSGLDVLCHSLESWTAIPYNERIPRPQNPINRPAYQGANPISDIFSLQALRSTVKYLPRAVRDPDDHEAQSEMLLAATLAGVGFGNAGVHLCHGTSYSVSGQNRGYKHTGYNVPYPIIPHGAPSTARRGCAVLSEAIAKFLEELGDQPRGLKDLGFGKEHIDELVEGTIPQKRVLMLAPGLAEELGEEREQLRKLFEESLVH